MLVFALEVAQLAGDQPHKFLERAKSLKQHHVLAPISEESAQHPPSFWLAHFGDSLGSLRSPWHHYDRRRRQ